MSKASYSCTALMGTNKVGTLPKDEKGLYTIVLGALDFFNSAGAFYPYEASKHLFEQSASLMRRIANGSCKAEYGHPKREIGMTDEDYIRRILTIDEKFVCCNIVEVWFEPNLIKDPKTGRQVMAIMGKIQPTGPYGAVLEKQLQNPHENVCFSIRSLTDDYIDPASGTLIKPLRIVVCWDMVNEPGISVANKYQSPSLEGIGSEMLFVKANFKNIKAQMALSPVAMESSAAIVDEVVSAFNWNVSTEAVPVQKTKKTSFKW